MLDFHQYNIFSIVCDKRATIFYRNKVNLAAVDGRVICE